VLFRLACFPWGIPGSLRRVTTLKIGKDKAASLLPASPDILTQAALAVEVCPDAAMGV
jgi:hypothetical protein